MPWVTGLMKNQVGVFLISGDRVSKRNASREQDSMPTVHEERNYQQGHQASLSIMHVESVADPRLALASNLALVTLPIPLGH